MTSPLPPAQAAKNEFSSIFPLLPLTGEVAIVGLDPAGGLPQTTWLDLSDSDDVLLEKIDGAVSYFERGSRNVYWSPSAFAHEPGTRKRRVATSARASRCFYFDLDCHGSAGQYGSKTEARAALDAFCGRLGLSASMIVDSGRGLQAFWGLTEDMSVTAWVARFRELAACATALNLRIDRACVADPARIMRMPGTWNHKAGCRATAVAQGALHDVAMFVARLEALRTELGVDTRVAVMIRPASPQRSPGASTGGPVRNGAAYASGALQRAYRAILTAPEGTRNVILNREAYAIARNFCDPGWFAPDTVRNYLADAAQRAGLDPTEADRTLASALGGQP